MYRRDGHSLPEKEEGAAIFGIGDDQIWGVSKDLFTRGFGTDAYDPSFAQSLMPSDEEAALNSGATTLPEVAIEGDPNAPVPFYESPIYRLLAIAGVTVGAYHGYKRNNSIGWAIVWALSGSLFPYVVIPIAVAQGIGKPKR
jgi:hypothetical protein